MILEELNVFSYLGLGFSAIVSTFAPLSQKLTTSFPIQEIRVRQDGK